MSLTRFSSSSLIRPTNSSLRLKHFHTQFSSNFRPLKPQNHFKYRNYSTQSSPSPEQPKKFPYRYVVATSMGMIGLSLWYFKEHLWAGKRADRAWEKENGIVSPHQAPLKGRYDNPKEVDWQEGELISLTYDLLLFRLLPACFFPGVFSTSTTSI
jgi:hypothetical protein